MSTNGTKVMGVVAPPQFIFTNKGNEEQEKLNRPNQTGEQFDRIEYPEEGGIYRHYFNRAYPAKGHPFKEAVDGIQMCKKLIVPTARFMKRHWALAGFFMVMPGFIKDRYVMSLMDTYLEPAVDGGIRPYQLEDKRYCKAAREINRAGRVAIAKQPERWRRYYLMILEFAVALIEWDNAYRFRIQDVLGELDKDAFDRDPAGELGRLIQLESQRERAWYDDRDRAHMVGAALRMAMRFNRHVERLARAFVREVELSKVRLDEADEYYCYMRPDYDIHGWGAELKQEKWQQIQNKYIAENTDRIKKGAERSVQVGTTGLLLSKLYENGGLPIILFYTIEEGGKTIMRMTETGVSTANPHLKDSALKILGDEINKNKKKDEPKSGLTLATA